MWIPALERAGVPYFRSYDLRHTCATLLLYEGRTLNEVAEHLGHADPGFTARTYAHVMRDTTRKRRVPITTAIRTARAVVSRRPLVDPSERIAANLSSRSGEKSLLNRRADARTRTGDPIITSHEQLSREVRPGRAKPHGSTDSKRPQWRPRTPNDKGVDPR